MDLSLATIVLWAVPVVFAITLHEAAHGYVARRFGDQTAYMLGRVTLNPLKHIDPIGTIAVPGFLIAVSVLTRAPLFIFGWAKPVPVNFGNLRHPRSEEHTSELQSRLHLVCRLLLEKKKKTHQNSHNLTNKTYQQSLK